MSKVLRVVAVVVTSGLLAIGSGCAQSNEEQAAITGIAPEGGPTSQAEMGAAMRGAAGPAADYPGAARRGQ